MSINIPEMPSSADGLGSTKMDRLESVVLLTGRNGSGKTRLLRRITDWGSRHILRLRQETYAEAKRQVENEEKATSGGETADQREGRLKALEPCRQTLQHEGFVVVEGLTHRSEIIGFVPENLELVDPSDLKRDQLPGSSKGVESDLGVSAHAQDVLARIQHLQDQWREVTHGDFVDKKREKDEIVNRYLSLRKTIERVLGTEIGRNARGEATIFGLPVGKAELSEGQKYLLMLWTLLDAQAQAIDECVVLLDEPESHLHPSALIDGVQGIIKAVPNGQVWIATHSLPLIAELMAKFGEPCIWYMEDGELSRAGRIPEKVLAGLVGEGERVDRLHDFLGLPAELATYRFALECLLGPEAFGANLNDPQTTQVGKILCGFRPGDSLKVLDYGAGKGRLLSDMHHRENIGRKPLRDWLVYMAYDSSDKHRETCEAAISAVYGTPEGRYFNSEQELRVEHEAGSFDAVVMCNTLHEIDPNEWLGLFAATGVVVSLLKDNGRLLLVEDCLMRTGEKAHNSGFIVLQREQVKVLFGISESDNDYAVDDERGDGRLLAHSIPRRCLAGVSQESVRLALKSLWRMAKAKVVQLRGEGDTSYKAGKRHAFWLSQLANAEIALDNLNLAEDGR